MVGRKSERTEQFYYYLHQNVCQHRRERDSGVNTKSAEEVLERREQFDKRVVASTTVFSLTAEHRCQGDIQLEMKEERHTASRMAMPANMAFAGGNGWRITIKKKVGRWVV